VRIIWDASRFVRALEAAEAAFAARIAEARAKRLQAEIDAAP
jgi:hypothetical protein